MRSPVRIVVLVTVLLIHLRNDPSRPELHGTLGQHELVLGA